MPVLSTQYAVLSNTPGKEFTSEATNILSTLPIHAKHYCAEVLGSTYMRSSVPLRADLLPNS
jgi:hypothetical protein